MSREFRHRRLLEMMDRRGLRAIALRQPPNFAWYTAGADNRVNHAAPLGAATLVVSRDGEYVVTSNIESSRMATEEPRDIEVVEHAWTEPPGNRLSELALGATLGADFPLDGAADVSTEVAALRRVLDADAIEQYRHVGSTTTDAVEETLKQLYAGIEEDDAGALLSYNCLRRGLQAPVVLVAADGRIPEYRHPIPKNTTAYRQMMLSVCGERYGLHASVTRFCYFDDGPDVTQRQRQKACASILERMRDEATRKGEDLREAFACCQRFYREEGFPDGWTAHHQGGLTGYSSRELIAGPDSELTISSGQAFAWNPSLPGAKAEETFILTERGAEQIAA